MVEKKFRAFGSTGETLPFGNLFTPSEVVERNGRRYDRYVIHVAMKLVEWKRCEKEIEEITNDN